MKYPTMEAVETADQRQLGIWCRFLASPGMAAIGQDDWETVMNTEAEIMRRICARFYDEFGGWNPKLSKDIGWDKR